jgi:N-acetylglucosaminyldiphosphoundecaprenol N-acetyl-beta-D-mannosaminyltransferase
MKKMQNSLKILGVRVSALTFNKTLTLIGEYIRQNKRGFICVSAVHLIMECQKDEFLRHGVNAATLVTPDGMPLVWLLRLRGYTTQRIYGPDLMEKICELAIRRGWNVFLLGGSSGQNRRLRSALLHKHPSLRLIGGMDTPTLPISIETNRKIIQTINSSKAHIVFVGMGCPLQELWMIKSRAALYPNMLVGVGAAFDFISGKKRQAPALVRRVGVEWLFRLIQEPKRLWRRYIPMNIHFLLLILKGKFQRNHQKRRSICR